MVDFRRGGVRADKMLEIFSPKTSDPDASTFKEFVGGLSTFLTLSYIFLLNPILLANANMPIEAAFFGTVIAATLSTLLMGVVAKVPFAVAPAPSITTFFVGYVCLELGLSWQAALAAVILSGVVSILMARLGAKAGLIRSMPEGLKYGVIFCLSGFLIASGMRQAGLITFSDRMITLDEVTSWGDLSTHPGTIIMLVGFAVTILLNARPFNFRGSPIFGILIATAVATGLGVVANRPTDNFDGLTAAVFQADFMGLFTSSAFMAILILFVIDFFGGVGKFVGLQKLLERDGVDVPKERIDEALEVDGWGNIIGGLVGASSLAVFISSAVGIKAGARTGLAAVFCAAFMLACLALIPIVGAIPSEATAGILIFIGLILLPWSNINLIIKGSKADDFDIRDLVIGILVAVITFSTFSIDIALMLLFAIYSIIAVLNVDTRRNWLLYGTALLLVVAVGFQ